MKPAAPCPCGSGGGYRDCCGRMLDQGRPAATAEQLMRSRYTAYVLRRAEYLLATWHPATRPAQLNFDDADAPRWLGLRVVAVVAGGAGDDDGQVEFIARYRIAAGARRMHEISRFVRQGEQWLYLDGQVDPAPEGAA